MQNGFAVRDPLQQRMHDIEMRCRVADGEVRMAIEAWVLVRAAYGARVQPALIAALAQSNLLSKDVAEFVKPPDAEAPSVVAKQ